MRIQGWSYTNDEVKPALGSNMSRLRNGCPQPGIRVQIANCKATVKYVGEIQGQEGTWIGLDWDDAARGKNEGSTGGKSYFQCSKPGSGSFLRLGKFEAQTKPGCTVLAAVQDRYGDQQREVDHTTEQVEQKFLPTAKKGVNWQFIGADKVHARLSQLQALQKATLINCCVSFVVSHMAPSKCILPKLAWFTDRCCASMQGNEQELQESLPQLQELDLTSNLLCSWQILQQMGNALPSLTCLNLSHNIMTMPSQDAMSSMLPNTALRVLVLNGCHLNWAEVSILFLALKL